VLHVPASKQDPQGYGSALTYARRYSLMAACGIAPEDDDGNAASKPRKPAAQEPAPARKTELSESALADHRAAIEAAATLEDIGAALKAGWASASDEQRKALQAAATSRKNALMVSV
jgi:hypothetical protein